MQRPGCPFERMPFAAPREGDTGRLPLRLVKQEEEKRDGKRGKRVEERREEHEHRLDAAQHIEKMNDERPCEENGCEQRCNECQECRTFERHGKSMHAPEGIRKNQRPAEGRLYES